MAELQPRSRPLRLAFAVLAAAIALASVHALTGLGGRSLNTFVDDWLYTAIEFGAVALCLARVVSRREDRAAWLLMAIALATWSGGDLVWTVWLNGLAHPPYPSIADALYLVMYPAIYVSLTLMLRAHHRHSGAAVWLDGVVVGLTTAALGAELILPALLHASSSAGQAALAVNLAYPLGDFSLLVFIALGLALSGWRPGRQWLVLGLGIGVSAAADLIFLYQEAKGTYVAGRILDMMWPLSMSLLALAAWQPPSPRPARTVVRRHAILLPTAFGAVSLALLVTASVQRVSPASVALATCAMVAAGLRAVLTYVENAGMLMRERQNAVTDSLTGLGNRRRLLDDLAAALERARQGSPCTLAFFDLDGFKRYNDSFGHGAGDALLARLGRALDSAVEGRGEAYRLGGDEFCVLLDGRIGPAHSLLTVAQGALAEQGSGFMVTASRGSVVLPDEAGSVSEALNLADERMYDHKAGGHASSRARAQTVLMQQSVLMQLLAEREPRLREHVCDVGLLAVAIGRRLNLNSEQLDELRRAAELHDLGKLAMPDKILNKPGPLNESEWRLMRQHTLIGERILSAAPALRPVARLVRSSHERWDGGGYPDGLAGEQIPLGSRIIAACDAFDAIITDRSYRAASTPVEAVAELQRHAGSQFDAQVVEALCAHVQAPLAATDAAASGSAARKAAMPEADAPAADAPAAGAPAAAAREAAAPEAERRSVPQRA
jgi:two-component system, cell cycle response regulator